MIIRNETSLQNFFTYPAGRQMKGVRSGLNASLYQACNSLVALLAEKRIYILNYEKSFES